MADAERSVAFAPPRQLVADDFILRAWSVNDATILRPAIAASEAHLRAWTPWVVDGRVPGQSMEEQLARHAADFAEGVEWRYGIFSLDGSDVLGGCGLYPRIGPGALEIGYWLAASHTGRGLATRAAAALTDVAFAAPDVEAVEIRCDRGNVASVRVPERLGYRLETAAAGATESLLVWRTTRDEFARRAR